MGKTEEISFIKERIARAQKTLLSGLNNFLSPKEMIIDDNDFSGHVPSLVVVFGECLTAAKDAGGYLRNYQKRYNRYPKVICLPSVLLNDNIEYGESVDKLLQKILTSMEIPEDVVYRNNFDYSSEKMPIDVLKSVIKRGHYKHVAVFSSRGYSVSTAIVLKDCLSSVNFKFFCNPYRTREMLCVDSEKLDSYGLDLLLGEIIRLNMRFNTLPEHIKKYILPMDIVKKYIVKGYVLGIVDEQEFKALGLSYEEYNKLLIQRINDFPWLREQKLAKKRIDSQIKELIEQ